jgi:diguanylate cyclase (GGDEF)-like protein
MRILLLRFALAILLCASWIGQPARAQAVLADGLERVDLWPSVRVLADREGTIGVDQALAMPDRFAPPAGAYATLGMAREVVWLRVPLEVREGGQGTWILNIDYALLRHVDVYQLEDGRVVNHALLGDSQPFAARPLRGRAHAMPLDFPASGSAELLLRVDTPGGKILPLTLERLPAFNSGQLAAQLLQGAFGGLGLFLLLYSLAQWFSLRESLYLKYALLVFFSVTFSLHFFGIGQMYLWTDQAWIQNHAAGATALLAAAATALFVEDAMAGDLAHWLATGLRAVAALHIAAAIAYCADLIDIRAVALLMSTTGLAPTLLGLPGALAKARRGDIIGVLFMVAWVGYFLASAVLVGVVRGRIGANLWTLHSFQIGATVDMIIFLRIATLRSAARHRDAQRAALERDRLHSLAHSDPLTGLLNRRGLDDVLAKALGHASAERLLAVYMLDLDAFKPVNDRFGHDVGDALLRQVATRLRNTTRTRDAVARLGGDEFVVMADGLANEAQARELGAKLLEALRDPFPLTEDCCSVTATIGYALAPADSRDASALLKSADAAMYAGKQAGKDQLMRAGP